MAYIASQKDLKQLTHYTQVHSELKTKTNDSSEKNLILTEIYELSFWRENLMSTYFKKWNPNRTIQMLKSVYLYFYTFKRTTKRKKFSLRKAVTYSNINNDIPESLEQFYFFATLLHLFVLWKRHFKKISRFLHVQHFFL